MSRRTEITNKYLNDMIKKLGFGQALIQIDLELRTGFKTCSLRERKKK